MKKKINQDCINMIITPLTENQSMSLEKHLHINVVEVRSKDEFVWVGQIPDVDGVNMISYGVNKADRFNKAKRDEIEAQLIAYGREWMRKNGFISSLH